MDVQISSASSAPVRTDASSSVSKLLRPAPDLHQLHPTANHAHRFAQKPVGGGVKRGFDVAVSALALAALSPVMLAVAALIWLEKPEPVLFKQRRGGFRGEVFHIYKFRTMRVADDGRDVRQAVRNDPRVTRLGAFLRRASLDELPQLVNVLRGEMSLVGPRPHAVSHDNQFARTAERYRHRQFARPGITGLAQVSGCRGATETRDDVKARVAADTAYVDHWSLLLDLQILMRTVIVVLRAKQAV